LLWLASVEFDELIGHSYVYPGYSGGNQRLLCLIFLVSQLSVGKDLRVYRPSKVVFSLPLRRYRGANSVLLEIFGGAVELVVNQLAHLS
jgi:hypothetical protein